MPRAGCLTHTNVHPPSAELLVAVFEVPVYVGQTLLFFGLALVRINICKIRAKVGWVKEAPLFGYIS